ncbi:MAG: hypothetical protein ACLR0U_08625 [Enterocloster clostridioformis]
MRELKGDLVFAIWDNNLMDYIGKNDMAENSRRHIPTSTSRWRKSKDDSESIGTP